MARAPRSKKQTLILCMEMYEWLRENPDKNKYDWPRLGEWRGLKLYCACFCCLQATYDCKKCALTDVAWFQEKTSYCCRGKSIYRLFKDWERYNAMVWACYVALNEIDPKTYPLNFESNQIVREL